MEHGRARQDNQQSATMARGRGVSRRRISERKGWSGRPESIVPLPVPVTWTTLGSPLNQSRFIAAGQVRIWVSEGVARNQRKGTLLSSLRLPSGLAELFCFISS